MCAILTMNIELRVNQNHVSGRANVRFMYMHVYVNIAIMIVELEHFLAEQIVATSEKMILIDKNTRKSSLYCEIINNNKTCLLIFSMKTFDQTASLNSALSIFRFFTSKLRCEAVKIRASNESCQRLCEDFTITEKAPTRAFS